MLLAQSQNRLLLAGGVLFFLVLLFFFRPAHVTTWQSSSARPAFDEDYYHDLEDTKEVQYEIPSSIPHDEFHDDPPAIQPIFEPEPLPLSTRVEHIPSSTRAHEQPQAHSTSAVADHNTATGVFHDDFKEAGHNAFTGKPQDEEKAAGHNTSTSSPLDGQKAAGLDDYNQVFSVMTPDKKWFPIDFGDYGSYNPNLLPHPWKNNTYVMIAQGSQTPGEAAGPIYSLELVCEAKYTNGTMKCLRSPITVPIASTVSDHCTGDLEWFNYFIGPNDPRVFFGPDRPYITYGSASQYTCLGQWIHDLRRLVMWNSMEALDRTQRFFWPTELQRPGTYGTVEKNWFAFWDDAGDMYLHYDIYPKRAFARVSDDGKKVSEDLAPITADRDDECIQKYMPTLKEKEHIHQATNSLAITMCKRDEAACDVRMNTFIFTIFHHKQYHGHNLYEPYIMVFKQSAPFNVHAISAKPFWINGRGRAGTDDPNRPSDQSQMMYITSMAWKAQNMTYQGYMDDELLINFGIEDKAAGAIDIVAGDLFREMNKCA